MEIDEASLQPYVTEAETHERWSHHQAMSLPIGDVVRQLVDVLGASTVAVIGNVSETRAVAQWMAGREPQRPHVLRFALQLVAMIGSVDDTEMLRAWFQGSNPMLNDEMPVLLLRNRPLQEIQPRLVAAAREFALHMNGENNKNPKGHNKGL